MKLSEFGFDVDELEFIRLACQIFQAQQVWVVDRVQDDRRTDRSDINDTHRQQF